jgi:bacterioferritin-associated ferredoxin
MLAGVDVAESLGRSLPGSLAAARRGAERAAARNRRFQSALAELYAAPRLVDQLADPQTLVCRCEEVSLEEIGRGFASGVTSLGALKRVTRAGMGRCQGRYCAPVLAELAARRSGRATEESDWFAPAPPFKPLPVDLVVAAAAGVRPGDPARTE